MVSFFAMFTLLFTSFLAYQDKQKEAKIYFVVLSIYVLIAFYIVSILIGSFEYFRNFWLFVPIFTLIDVSLFSIVLYIKLKKDYKAKIEQEQFIISQADLQALEIMLPIWYINGKIQ